MWLVRGTRRDGQDQTGRSRQRHLSHPPLGMEDEHVLNPQPPMEGRSRGARWSVLRSVWPAVTITLLTRWLESAMPWPQCVAMLDTRSVPKGRRRQRKSLNAGAATSVVARRNSDFLRPSPRQAGSMVLGDGNHPKGCHGVRRSLPEGSVGPTSGALAAQQDGGNERPS